MHTVAVAAIGHLLHFELGIAYEIFGNPPVGVDDWYDVQLCGPTPIQVGPFQVAPSHDLDQLASAGTILVPALADVDERPPAALVAAIRSAHRSGTRIASLCTGAFVLGAAGLLDGRRATTHWAHTAELQSRYPEAEVDPDVLYTDNGDVLTAAGKAAAVDLCLHLIHRDHGATIANTVARRLVVPPHRAGGQAQFVSTPVQPTGDHSLANLLAWAQERLDQPLTVADLAKHAGTSPRHLGRQFRAVTGQTPLQWLLTQRVRRAQQLLESTDVPVEKVAVSAGLGTATTLRRHFQRAVGVPPNAYRQSFRST